MDKLLPRMPEPLGLPVEISCFVDADHAGNLLTRRSQSGVLIFLNKAPIVWYSKRQNMVESSTFASEFVAMHIATDLIVSLCYKLRMFGVPLTGAANVFVTIKELSIIPLHQNPFWARSITRFVTIELGRWQQQV